MGGFVMFFALSRCRPWLPSKTCLRLAAGLPNWAPLRSAEARGFRCFRSWTPSDRYSGCRVYCTVPRDVVLFEHDRTAFFRLLTGFCAGQLLFWTYLAHFAYTGLRNSGGGGKHTVRDGSAPGDRGVSVFGVSLGSNTWRYSFTVGCMAVGAAIVGFSVLFCRRSVSRVVLHQGGTTVTLTMQSPLGIDKAHCMKLPLAHVACHAHRLESPSFIPLRVKGHRLYFLLDKDGKLNNPKLFDVTVGAYRPL